MFQNTHEVTLNNSAHLATINCFRPFGWKMLNLLNRLTRKTHDHFQVTLAQQMIYCNCMKITSAEGAKILLKRIKMIKYSEKQTWKNLEF